MPQTLVPPVEDGPWAKGVDSYLEATQVQKNFYRWGVNISNRGGIVRTRPGYSVIPVEVSPHNQHPAVVALTTADIDLSGEQLIDSVQTDQSRVALVGQINEAQNGIYVTATGAWHRAGDANNPNNIRGQFLVSGGGIHSNETWMLTTPPPITLNVTPLNFALSPSPELPPVPLIGTPRGITIFEDVNHVVNLVVAIGQQILYTPYPFTDDFTPIDALMFEGVDTPVVFVRCIVSVTEADDGTLTDIDPYPILMIQDGVSRAGYWKSGQDARHLDPSKKDPYKGPSETPIGLWGEWSGNRYWVANGSRMRASNLLNPIKFTEEDLLQEGGFLQFPSIITGVSNTPDFRAMLVYTDLTTSTLQTSIIDRTSWAGISGFQVVIFYGIGCVGGNAIATQWGLKWWYSHDGLMSLDEGLRAYQSSKVTYRDREMAWSKTNVGTAFRRNIAMGADENLLFISAPSGDRYNAHTWVMDEAPLDVLTYWGYFGLPAWSGVWEGIRPVAWITAPVNGVHRTFCLSKDYPFGADPNIDGGQNNVWEVATGARIDRTHDAQGNIITRPISCSLETKLIGYDGNYKFFRFAEIYLDNVEGEVDLTVSYAPRRGGYKVVLRKHVISSDWILQNVGGVPPNGTQIPWFLPEDPDNPNFIFNPTIPQSRVVRTISEAKTYTTPESGDDIYQSVQTSANVPFPRQKDYGFSLLIEWVGRMSISSVRCYFDAEEQEVEGIVELDETTNRFLIMDGTCAVAPPPKTDYIIDPDSFDFQSNMISGTFPIWTDPIYQSIK